MPAPIDENTILEAALSVWREHGFRNATTRKVAERAGIGEVTLFRRFSDKSALFGAALATQADAFSAVATDYTGDLVADLSNIVEAYAQLLETNGAIVLDFLIEARRNDQLKAIAPIPMAAIMQVATVVQRYQSAGKLRPTDPFGLVLSLLGPLIVRHAVAQAQPMISARQPTRDYVEMWLAGHQAS